MEEAPQQQAQHLRELQEELSELNSLKKHRGYIRLLEIAKNQIEARQETILLKPLRKTADVWEQEYAKGEVSGISLFMKITDIQVDDLESQIQELNKTEENENVEE